MAKRLRVFFSYIYEEEGIGPFLLIGIALLIIVWGIWASCTLGTDSCIHFFQNGHYCTYCGDALHEYCSNCGKVVDGSSFCGSCGHAVK